MATRISGKGFTITVDESPDEVKKLLDDGQPHVFVPFAAYNGGTKVEPEPVVLSIADVSMLADASA